MSASKPVYVRACCFAAFKIRGSLLELLLWVLYGGQMAVLRATFLGSDINTLFALWNQRVDGFDIA